MDRSPRHHNSPSRFSYARDFRPSVFSYGPRAWPARHARVVKETAPTDTSKQAMIAGGVVLGMVAVGALVWMAAKH